MRTALCLAAALVALPAHGATLSIGLVQPPNTLRIHPVFVEPNRPSSWKIRSLKGVDGVGTWGTDYWVGLGVRNDRLNIGPPPFWSFVHDVFIDRDVASFWWAPKDLGVPDVARLELAEFVAAGDTAITLYVDSSKKSDNGPWHIMTFDSPNLGMVTREFTRLRDVPEPAGVALLAVGAMMLRRRRHG